MGLLDKDFTENFELGFNDVFSLQRPIDFPIDVTNGESHCSYYTTYRVKNIRSDAEKLAGVKIVSDSKGRLRPDHADLIQIIMDKFIGAQWKEIIWSAKPYVSIASDGNKIYFTIMTKLDFTTTYNRSDVVCRILCTTK